MVLKKYEIMMHTPIGKRYGDIRINIDKEKIKGYITLLSHCEPVNGSIDENGKCILVGRIVTLMNVIPFTATGEIEEDRLFLSLKGRHNSFQIEGKYTGMEEEVNE
ncbi:MAG: hypothetical protein ACI4WM_05590 [Erysipelotrichaceae bacterium]